MISYPKPKLFHLIQLWWIAGLLDSGFSDSVVRIDFFLGLKMQSVHMSEDSKTRR